MSASFEVDRLEWVAPDRIEVAGRWFGVRGLRFVRPSLDVEAGDERRHLLALLDHKPWEAHDGDEWVAAFPWDGDAAELSYAELAVTPAVVVELPVDGSGTARPPKRDEPKDPPPSSRRVRTADREDRPRAESQALRRERDAALAARDAARHERDAAAEERDAAAQQRDAATQERDAALRERDALAQERDAAVAARDAAAADAEASAMVRDGALAELESAIAEREAAYKERDAAKQSLQHAARDAAKAANEARDAAVRERDAAVAERDAAKRALEEHSRRPPALNVPPVPDAPARTSSWSMRLVVLGALVVLLGIFVALIQSVL